MRLPSSRLLSTLLALHLTAGLCASGAAAQQRAAAPRTEPIARISYSGEMVSLLAKMAQEFGVNVGVVIDANQLRRPVKLDLNYSTLPDVLDAVVKSAPDFKWRETVGGVEVSTVRGGSALLDAPISGFWVSDVDQAEAIELLMNLPEVRASMAEMNLQYRSPGGATARSAGERFSLELEGMSLRQALNKIVERSGSRFWLFRKFGGAPEGEFITIGIADR